MDNIKIGHYDNGKTGVTVVLTPSGAVGGCSIRGSAPATREVALLDSHKMIQAVHAVVLTGGSAFGLDSCGGVMRYYSEEGIGVSVGKHKIPIVCGAAIFDFLDKTEYPTADFAYKACKAASDVIKRPKTGIVGVGAGATVGKACGIEFASKGGVGYARRQIGDLVVMALVVTNAVGDIVRDGKIIAGAKHNGGFLDCNKMMLGQPPDGLGGQSTTLGIIITNAKLTKVEVNKLADISHNAYAMTISPVHTEYDGDAIFALSAGDVAAEYSVVSIHAIEAMKEAIWDSVAD